MTNNALTAIFIITPKECEYVSHKIAIFLLPSFLMTPSDPLSLELLFARLIQVCLAVAEIILIRIFGLND